MTPPPSPPTRRRRWPIVVGAVLTLVFLRTWWTWPRIDERLVGTWTLTPDLEGRLPPIDFEQDGAVQRFTYRSDDGIRTRIGSCWWVAGNRLIVAGPRPSAREPGEFVGYWTRRAFGWETDFQCEIQEIGPSILRVHQTASGIDSVYVRK